MGAHFLKTSGKVTYNGHEMHEFVPQRTAAYISQQDLQLGELTVRETFDFSSQCQGVGPASGECYISIVRTTTQYVVSLPPNFPSALVSPSLLGLFFFCMSFEL
jgi:ribosomal protein S9